MTSPARPREGNCEFCFSYVTGMDRTWKIFARICLLCSGNLSSRAFAKCDPRFFALAKTFRLDYQPLFGKPMKLCESTKHQGRRSAWVGQADFGKGNNGNHSGNCQRLSAYS